jgi:PadR family transcriptional regulator, regulatory protein PadR
MARVALIAGVVTFVALHWVGRSQADEIVVSLVDARVVDGLCRCTSMADPALSFTGLFVLQALARDYRYGFDIMDVTGLPSGTIYPALRRLEALDLVRSDWEDEQRAYRRGRPRRRYYELTAAGKRRLAEAEARYRAVGQLFTGRSRA